MILLMISCIDYIFISAKHQVHNAMTTGIDTLSDSVELIDCYHIQHMAKISCDVQNYIIDLIW